MICTVKVFVMWSLLLFLPLITGQQTSSTGGTCTVAGKIFQRGESVRDAFETRCGPWEDYPCFCNPDLVDATPPFVECPYCGFATATPGLLRCARDTQEITFIGLESQRGQRCLCDASDAADPASVCFNDRTAGQCRIQMEDGSVAVYEPGEIIQKASRCGSIAAFPCTCNPNVPGQIECPYCAFSKPADELECIPVGGSSTFLASGNVERTCDCLPPPSPSFPFETTCEDISVPLVGPQAQCSYRNPSNGVVISVDKGANLAEVDVDLSFLANGLSPCGPPEDWPCFCNPSLPNQVECPYCTVEQPDGSFICALDEQQFEIPTPGDASGRETTCFCSAPSGGSTRPKTTCADLDGPVCTVRLDNGNVEQFLIGEPIVGLRGPCGSSLQFPYICNPPGGDTGSDVNLLEYPYCQFDTATEGTKACAKDGSSTIFEDPQGIRTTCDCQFRSPTSGANVTCRVTPGASAAPTMAPPPVATSQSAAHANKILGFGSSHDIFFVGSLAFLLVLTL